MPREQLLELQRQRSEQFGVEVLSTPQARLTFPSGWPRKWSAVADPVNIRYRIDGDGYLRAARARFKSSADVYKQEESRRVVHTRIVQRMLRRGMRVAIDPEDALDALLPARIRRQNTRGVEGAPGELRVLPMMIRRGPDLPAAADNGAGVENFVIEAIVATNAVITRFTKTGEPEIIERKALESIGRWLTTKYRTMFLDHDRKTRVGRVLEFWIEDNNTGESTSQLVIRALVSQTRGDLQQQIREGTLGQLSVWFGVPAGSAKREWNDKLKAFVWRFLDAEGYEASLVGMAVDPGAEIRTFAVARSVRGAAGATLEVGFEVARAAEARGDAFVVRYPIDGLDLEMVSELAGTLRGAAIFSGENDDPRGRRIYSAEVRDGALELGLELGGEANCSAEAPVAFVLRGVARIQDDRVVALSFDHAELSADGEERGFKEIGMSDTTEATKPTRAEGYKRINELLASLKAAADEEAASELRGELDDAYGALELADGEKLPHPLSGGFEGEYPWATAAPPPVVETPVVTPPVEQAPPVEPPVAPPPTAETPAVEPPVSSERSVTDRDFEQLWSMTGNLVGVVARLRELLTPKGVPVEPTVVEPPSVGRAVAEALEAQKVAFDGALEAERKRSAELERRLQCVERGLVGAPPSRDIPAPRADAPPSPATELKPQDWNAFAMKNRKVPQPGTAA